MGGSPLPSALCADSQSVAYGSCIGKNYKEVHKDMCGPEFKAFKECVQVGVAASEQRRSVGRTPTGQVGLEVAGH